MADDKELSIVSSAPLPELSIVSSETDPITSKPKNDEEWNALKQQHGLPPSYDLSKTLIENYGNLSKDEINSIDLNKLQQAYSIANPQEARKPGFFNNIWGEGVDIVKGLLAKADTVAGSPAVGPAIEAAKDNPINAVPVVGPVAVQRGRQLASGDISGALGAGSVDLAALLAPVVLHKAIEAVPENASPKDLSNQLGRALYDPKTGEIVDLRKAAQDALVRKLIKDPYEVERNAARVGKTFDQFFDEFQKSRQEASESLANRMSAAEKVRQQELSQFGRLKAIDEAAQAKDARLAAKNAPKPYQPLPFQGATSTSPAETATMVPKSLPNTPAGSASPLPQPAAMRTTPFPARFVSKFESPEASPEVSDAAQDLISRNTRVVRPDEMPSAADLKRAGDYTQIPALKLKALKKFGDRLAAIELTRRGIND